MPKPLVSILMMFAALCLQAEKWAPIPAEVWAIRSGPKGAVVLEERMRFDLDAVKYVYRVRIFSEEGIAAAAVPDFPNTAIGIDGRTVYPDGRQVIFRDRKDFAERKAEVGGSRFSAKHLVAPGITSDCVMELTWSEVANGVFGGLPWRFGNGLFGQWTLANPFPTQRFVVEMSNVFPLLWILDPGMAGNHESKSAWAYQVVTLKNLSALEVPSYGLKPQLGFPTLLIFAQSKALAGVNGKGPEAFWNEAARAVYKEDYENHVLKGPAFMTLATELMDGLPEAHGPKAGELLNRLNRRVVNLSWASNEEEEALPKDFWGGFDPRDLDKTAKTGKTNGRGMRLLYFHLLKQAGFAPKIGKVVDREKGVFRWDQENPWQFHHDLIGIDLPGGQIGWLDPTLRHAAPGVIHPDYTATDMLQIDSATWKASRGWTPAREASLNGRKYTYAMRFSEDGDSFDMKGEFSGYPEYVERKAFLPLEAKEQGKVLRERIEKSLKNAVISEATVINVADPQKNVVWHVKGTLERDPGRIHRVDPFPGMPWPLWIPAKLEAERKTPIVLPYLSTHVAVSRFRVPPGHTPRPLEELRKENEFGRVFWVPRFDSKSGQIEVILRVEVTAILQEADHWEAFKTFLGWIETACRRQVVLVKEG